MHGRQSLPDKGRLCVGPPPSQERGVKQSSLREGQSIQWPYFSVFEWVMQKADPFLFFTSFLLSDSQKAKIFSGWLGACSGWLDACPAAKIFSGWICVNLPSITPWMSVGTTVCSWDAI
jgi:hypothetical protein